MFNFDNPWIQVPYGDLRAFGMYRSHYSAVPKPHGIKGRQFIPTADAMILMTATQDALFVWRHDRPDKRMDGQVGINCSIFRNEGSLLSSELILAAEEMAWMKWPKQRVFTFVDGGKIESVNPGYCFKKAGWQKCGESKRGLAILEKMGV